MTANTPAAGSAARGNALAWAAKPARRVAAQPARVWAALPRHRSEANEVTLSRAEAPDVVVVRRSDGNECEMRRAYWNMASAAVQVSCGSRCVCVHV